MEAQELNSGRGPKKRLSGCMELGVSEEQKDIQCHHWGGGKR